MYLITIHVPIYVRGKECLLATDWKRSLELLRDSLGGRFGKIWIVAPSLPADLKTDQALEPVNSEAEDIYLVPSFPLNTRARDYWKTHRHQWSADVNRHAVGATVVHSGFDDCYRPMSWMGLKHGIRHDKPTIFVQDTDHVGSIEAAIPGLPLRDRPERWAYKSLYERCVRECVSQASLSLLKGQDLMRRYGTYAKNAKNFHDTSYFSQEIISPEVPDQRLFSLMMEDRPLRFVYCGRLEARKGVDHSVRAIARARQLGANVTLDIIGDGAERGALTSLVSEYGAGPYVKFLGQRAYNQNLLRDLSGYDALLFTPKCEDTPRMIFDGYSAGLPLVGYTIPYVQERDREDHTVIGSPVNDVEALASTLCSLDSTPSRLIPVTKAAQSVAHHHSADAWYKRRADWTFEAVGSYRKRR
jgi:glycosyltransferase involved in cell wall biosynthesis